MKELETAKIDSLKSIFIKKGVNPQIVDGLIALEKTKGNLKFKVDEQGSKVFFKDKEIVELEDGKIQGIDDWLATKESQSWLLPKGNNGFGGIPTGGSTKLPDKSIKEMSKIEKINYIKENGEEAFKALVESSI